MLISRADFFASIHIAYSVLADQRRAPTCYSMNKRHMGVFNRFRQPRMHCSRLDVRKAECVRLDEMVKLHVNPATW